LHLATQVVKSQQATAELSPDLKNQLVELERYVTDYLNKA